MEVLVLQRAEPRAPQEVSPLRRAALVPRRAPRRDANEPAIIAALEAIGASVTQLDAPGVPDLLVGWRGRTFCIEVKDGAKSPSRRKLTPDQRRWALRWRGHRAVCLSPNDALWAIGACREQPSTALGR